MSLEQTGITKSESTVDFDHPRPVRDFLAACGFSVENFPHIRLVLEIPKKLLKNSQSFVPLRIPAKPGLVFESFARVIRVCEIPTATEGHRKLLEVDWYIDENPMLEAECHAAFSFVSSDVQCPSCKSIFLPDAQVVDEACIRISCPSCLHYWTIRVESPQLSKPLPRLLTDVFYREPMKLKKILSSAAIHYPGAQEYFPTQFKLWEDELSMGWLFEDRKGFVELDSKSAHDDFDILWKSFLNSQFHLYFSESREPKMTSSLDNTEIFRKSEIQQKAVAIVFDDLPGEPLESKFKPIASVRTEVRDPIKPRTFKYAEPKVFPWGAAMAAGLLFVSFGFGYFAYHTIFNTASSIGSEELTTASVSPMAPVVLVPPAPVAQPAPEPVKIKAPEVLVPAAPVEVKKVARVPKEEILRRDAEKIQERNEQVNKARESLIEGSLRQGTQFMNDKNYDQASVEFKKVLELDPSNPFAYRNLGISYVYIQRYNEAISTFEKYLTIAKDDQDRAYIKEMLASLKDSSGSPSNSENTE